MSPVNLETLWATKLQQIPFTHVVLENFLTDPYRIACDFLPFESGDWFTYDTDVQVKKACNNWFLFPPATYSLLHYLMSDTFVHELGARVGCPLYPDFGLHGGGWHIHGNGGILKPHLDYSIHPKMGLQRKLNLIVYVESNMKTAYGGSLGLWAGDADKPGNLIRSINPLFNRAVLFDTTQNSWHGMCEPLSLPEHVYRKSIAVYYLCEPGDNVPLRGRAEFWRAT